MIEFFAPESAPFMIGLAVVVAIGVVELVSLLVGFSPSASIDAALPHADFDVPHLDGVEVGPLSHLLGWLSVGKVPLLVLLIIFLTSFALAGYGVQTISKAVLGVALHPLIASIPALAGGLFASRYLGRWLGTILPKDQTEAASQQDLIGSFATIIRGEARQGKPAEAKAKDLRGRTHYLLVEPNEPDEVLTAGSHVLLIRQESSVYRAVTKLNSIKEGQP